MKLFWAADKQKSGGFYGYSLHSRKLRAALEGADVTVVSHAGAPADFAVHVVPPDEFRPLEGLRNLLYTTCETSPLRKEFRNELINRADLLVVPSKFCAQEFARFYPRVPIERCPLGIDPADFPFCERTPPRKDEPFVFLWVGSVVNNRKGPDIVNHAWRTWMARSLGTSKALPGDGKVLLYMKVSGKDPNSTESVQRLKLIIHNNRVVFAPADQCPSSVPDLPAIVIDSRDLSTSQMLEVYRSAHMFLMPSRGEGFGLTLCEALATGLPSAWTAWSGMRDFALEAGGFPLRYKVVQNELADTEEHYALADSDHLIGRMQDVLSDFPSALERAKKASARIHSQFTWRQVAEKFIAICEQARGAS